MTKQASANSAVMMGKRLCACVRRWGLALIVSASLAACGGGGGTSPQPPTPPTPPPSAPGIGVSIAGASKVEGSTFTFDLTRTGSLTASSSVAYAVTGAVSGADFVGGALPSGTVTFAAGVSAATITITTVDDTAVEPAENFTLTIAAQTNAAIGTGSAAATITDNDTASAPSVNISIATASRAEGSTFTFNLARSGSLANSSQIRYAVTGAASAADFAGGVAPSGTINFAANTPSATISIATVDDALVEGSENFTVTITAVTNAVIGAASAVATITDNDVAPPSAVKIVVLGASTASGKNIWKLFPGTTVADEPQYANLYGWIATYGAYLNTQNAASTVINLALSGYSTTRALNDTPSDGSYQNSLAYAIAQHPDADAFIFNFPAVRGQKGETVASVVSNLTQMSNRALAAGVRQVWIATAEPYDNATDCFVINSAGACHATLTVQQTRINLTNQIISAFPGRYVDFFRPLAINNSINQVFDPALLNSVDLQHPNVQGHLALKNAVINAHVYEALQ